VGTPEFVEYLHTLDGPYRVLPLNAMTFINRGSRFAVESITGYNPLTLLSYQQLLGVIRGEPVLPSDRVPMVARYSSPLLDLLDVKYVVSEEPLMDPALALRYRGDTHVYERRAGTISRAAMVFDAIFAGSADQAAALLGRPDFDPLKTVVIMDEGARADAMPTPEAASAADAHWQAIVTERAFNRIRVDVDTAAPGWLVLGEVFYPGWKAVVDGVEAPLHRANLALRAVPLQAGKHVVEMRYEPRSFQLGVLLSSAGMLATVALVVVARRSSRDVGGS
jgi:hypothetical protein